jgi:hypothetical protein
MHKRNSDADPQVARGEILSHRFQPRALFAFDALAPPERANVIAKLDAISGTSPDEWPLSGAAKLNDQSLYLLRVDASLRVLVCPAVDGSPEVVDVFRHETLKAFGVLQDVS